MKQHRAFTEKQKKLLSGGAIAVFLLLGAALAWFVGRPLIRFAREPEVFRAWVADHGLLGMAAYTGKSVTWDEIMASDLDLSLENYEFGPFPGGVNEIVPKPGKDPEEKKA